MSKFTRYFSSKPAAKAWVSKCKSLLKGCYYGAVYTMCSSSHYHAYICGEFTEEEALSTCAKKPKLYRYEK